VVSKASIVESIQQMSVYSHSTTPQPNGLLHHTNYIGIGSGTGNSTGGYSHHNSITRPHSAQSLPYTSTLNTSASSTSSSTNSSINVYSSSGSGSSNDSIMIYDQNGEKQRYNIVTLSDGLISNKQALPIPSERLIIDVWQDNLHYELGRIMEIVDQYNYIAMDTEFPGVVARPVGSFKNSGDYHYQTLKCNVDLLKIIQLGLCLCDEHGNMIPGMCCWQFNFRFSLSEDMYAQDSIDLLSKSGIDFNSHAVRGIDVHEFGELLIGSGIVLNEDVKWLSFHSGYDYGYLLKLLTAQPMPSSEAEFFEWMQIYFPCVYDIKYLMKSCDNLTGGLQKVAEMLNVERIGPQHQAGSDSLLTAATFFKLRKNFFNDTIDDKKFMGILFGLGSDLQSPDPSVRKKRQNASVNASPQPSASIPFNLTNNANQVKSDDTNNSSTSSSNNTASMNQALPNGIINPSTSNTTSSSSGSSMLNLGIRDTSDTRSTGSTPSIQPPPGFT